MAGGFAFLLDFVLCIPSPPPVHLPCTVDRHWNFNAADPQLGALSLEGCAAAFILGRH